MNSKRSQVISYKIAGRDGPTVQVSKLRRAPSQPSTHSQPPTAAKNKKRRRSGPRTDTFSIEGTLNCPVDDTLGSQPDQTMTELPFSSPPPPSDFDCASEDLPELVEAPNEVDPEPSRRTANTYLTLWLDGSSADYLETIYECDAPPDTIACDGCLKPTSAIYRCKACLNIYYRCAGCLVSEHRFQPLHRVQHWDGLTWTNASLAELGLVLSLGHRGKPCSKNASSSELLVGDLNGFHTVHVRYCSHSGAPNKALQLLSAGLFPCSDIQPRSAFTISLLDTYNIFLTLGRTSAYKFYSVLERLTEPGFPGDVKDRYRKLMATHRKYLFLTNWQRSGHGFEPHTTDVHLDNQALDCATCPRPGINFDWAEVPEDEYEWFRAYVSYDGNFRSVRKNKKVDPDDVCLSDGKAYFPPKAPYKGWTEAQDEPQRTEKPTCDHHKAAKDASVRPAGRDVTGVGALTCTSHSSFVPQGMVDFFKGERYIYADYAFASAVHHLTRGDRLAFGLTYDIWCHWIKNFSRRSMNLPSQLALPSTLDLVGAIPKWHLVGHNPECYVLHSLDHKQYVGRMEGEGPERVWAHLNEHSGSTSEQGPGVRTDTINNLAYEWNYEKMIRLAQQLPAKFKEAKRMFKRQEAVHQDLTASLPPAKITEWEAASIEPVQGCDKKWRSPLMDPVLTDGRFQEVVQAESKKESSTSRIARRRPGGTRFLSDGIELEHSQRKVRDEAKAIGFDPTPRQAESLTKQRITLRDCVLEFKERRSLYMGALTDVEPNHPDRAPPLNDEPENWDLGLPSSYTSDLLLVAGLASFAELEKDLRRGVCNDNMDSTRDLLGAQAFAINYKKRHVRGEVATTRSEAAIRAHSDKVAKARWRYDNSRNALLRLGPSDSDLRRYREMTDDDLRTLKSFLQDSSRGVGQGYATIPWIWRTGVAPNNDEWQINALKTEWFRSRERFKRWKEQLILLKREMTMTIRTFRKREEIWKWKAQSARSTPGMQSYALKQSRFYGELACRALGAFREYLCDDIVALVWTEGWLQCHVNDSGFKG